MKLYFLKRSKEKNFFGQANFLFATSGQRIKIWIQRTCAQRNSLGKCIIHKKRRFFLMNKTEKVQSKTARKVCYMENLLAMNKHTKQINLLFSFQFTF